jgi:outer membrane receptor protein involved in Fe transport
MSAGVELQRERAGSTYITGAELQPVQVKRRTAGFFAEARWNRQSNLFVSGGVRVDDIHRERLEETPDPFVPRPVLDADSVLSVNPRVAVAWFVGPGAVSFTKLRAAAATGIRPPDGFELAFTDNSSLKPERSFSIEGGVEHAFAEGRALAEAVVFHNSYDDLIVAVGSFRESSRYITDNISNARARGVELGVAGRHRLSSPRPMDVHGRVAYTLVDSEILAVDGTAEAPPPFETGDSLLRRPRHQLSVEGGLTAGRLIAFFTGGARGRALDVEPSFGTFGGLFHVAAFSVWNAGASWRLQRTTEVFGRIENMFDREYEEALGFPALGRRVTIGLRVAAGR